MSYDAILAELVDGLQAAGRENFNAADSDEAMERIAEPIARAICDGVDFSIKGTATVAEINAMQDMEDGDTWAVTDSGTITNSDETTVEVTAGDLVRWNGERWVRFLHIDLSGYVTDGEFAAAIAVLAARIDAIPIIEVDPNLDPQSSNPVENRAVNAAIQGKQDQLTEMTDQEVNDLVGALN